MLLMPWVLTKYSKTEECQYCKKGGVIRYGAFNDKRAAGEWVCAVCGKTNRAKPVSR